MGFEFVEKVHRCAIPHPGEYPGGTQVKCTECGTQWRVRCNVRREMCDQCSVEGEGRGMHGFHYWVERKADQDAQ